VIAFASLISREALHFTQYPVATGHLHARISTRRRGRNERSGTHPV
jgi:hypothetical protein